MREREYTARMYVSSFSPSLRDNQKSEGGVRAERMVGGGGRLISLLLLLLLLLVLLLLLRFAPPVLSSSSGNSARTARVSVRLNNIIVGVLTVQDARGPKRVPPATRPRRLNGARRTAHRAPRSPSYSSATRF